MTRNAIGLIVASVLISVFITACSNEETSGSIPSVPIPSPEQENSLAEDVNDAPSFSTEPPLNASEGVLYQYNAQVEDPDDGDSLTYSFTKAPVGMSVEAATGAVTWTPTSDQSEDQSVTLQVTDTAGASDKQSWVIQVDILNQPPEITTATLPGALEDEPYRAVLQATDENGADNLVFSLEAAPSGMVIDAQSGHLSWSPINAHIGAHSVTVRATDPDGLYYEATYNLVVENVNDSPVITSNPPLLATEGAIYQYNTNVIDPDTGDELTYSLSTAPAGMDIDAETGEISWTPTGDQGGNQPVTLTVTDLAGAIATQSFIIGVEIINEAPAVTSNAVTQATVNLAYQYSVAASDPDGDEITFSLSPAPTGMTIDADTGLIEWTPTSGQEGDNPVAVQVADPAGLSDSQSFNITVAEQNLPPQITTTSLPDALVGQAYQAQVEATDPNTGDVLSYALTAAPAGMNIDANTGMIDWQPAEADVGTANLTVRVTDDQGLVDERSFSISVQVANQPPAFNSTPVTEAVVGSLYNYAVQSTDPDGDALTYSLTVAPSGMSIDTNTGVISWTPTSAQDDDHAVTVQVSDGQNGTASQSFTVQVIGANVAPAISSTPVLYAVAETSYHYTVNASDPDGDALTYSLHTAPFGMSINANTGAIDWTPSSAQEGDHAVTVQLNDGQGGSASQSFTVQVTEPNVPVIISTPVLEATSDSLYQYLVLATDPDGDVLTFSLEYEPSGMSIDTSTGLINWIPSIAQKGQHRVRVRVRDGDGYRAEQWVSIDVTGPNSAPVISSSPVLQANAESQYYYGIAASDSDGDALTYSLDVAPSGMTFNAEYARVIDWAPTSAQIGDHAVTVQVSDGNGGSVTQAFTVQVLAPLDSDYDGVPDFLDQCPGTATAFNPYANEADENGCALHQLDTDEDGVNEHLDICPDTLPFEIVDPVGCAPYQLDLNP